MSDGMGREPAYLSSHATNRYFIPNWGQSIDGKVMENDSIPVPYATVSLLQTSDSAYVAGVIGGEDGSFSFDTNSSGKI